MRRRDFIKVIVGGTAAAWPFAIHAQQPAQPVIGFIHGTSMEENRYILAAFAKGLNETGYIEGRNVAVEYRWANGHYDQLPALAADLVHHQVTVILANTPAAAVAAKMATTSIPIVFSLGSDPVNNGLVPNLNRPGGNVTGATFFANLLDGKRLGFVHQLLPNGMVIGGLVNEANPNAELETRDMQEGARDLGLQLIVQHASTESEIEQALANLVQQHVAAVVVAGDSFLGNRAGLIAKLAAGYSLPTSFSLREHAAAGGLMSYGASITDTERQAAIYVGRILKGEKAGDLPVQQPSKFEFVINLKTAKTLGLTIPYSIQLLADEVIE
jgi:putative ABC transport system substrate-binding protein